MKNPKQTQLQILKKREYTMYNFYINSNGTKEGPYSAAEMTALQLAATTPVTEQSSTDGLQPKISTSIIWPKKRM